MKEQEEVEEAEGSNDSRERLMTPWRTVSLLGARLLEADSIFRMRSLRIMVICTVALVWALAKR